MLAVRNLTIDYSSHGASECRAVDNVSFDLASGETLGVLGASGCGKTTVALALLGMFSPAAHVRGGSVRFSGREMLSASETTLRGIRGAEMSIVFQEPALSLNPVLRVGQQVAEVIRAHTRQNPRDCAKAAQAALAAVQLPGSRFYSAYPHQLSAGQRQRVSIAQALACGPTLLIADEPTSALDNTTQAEILLLLKELKKRRGMAMLFITHNPALLNGLADRVLTMQAGRVVDEGALKMARPVMLFQRPEARENSAELIAEPLVKVRALTKRYVQSQWFSRARFPVTALAGIDLDIRPQRTLALVGESGAGKSTLARCLAGLEKPDSGQILFDGKVQLIFQDSATALNPGFTAAEIVEEPLRLQTGLPKSQRRERALAAMERVGLSPAWAGRSAMQFSGGQRQRLAIARALLVQPDFLILDEALSGLDVSTQSQIASLLLDLQASQRFTYLFITHNLRFAGQFADEIAVMKEGKILECGPASEIISHPQTAYARELVAAIPGD